MSLTPEAGRRPVAPSTGDPVHELVVHSRRHPPGLVVLDVVGEIDLHTAASLLEAAAIEIVAGCRVLVLDLTAVSFWSARGIGTLVEVRRLAQRHGAAVHVVPSERVRRLATLLGDDVPLGPPHGRVHDG